LGIAHDKTRPYPVYSLGPGRWYFEDEFNKYVEEGLSPPRLEPSENQDEFIEALSRMLNPSSLVGALQGLIARVGDL
jgi:hypothetical protein